MKTIEEAPPVYRLKMTRMSDVSRRWPMFLYPQRVPMSALTMLGGDPGLGKSTWTAYLAGRVTRGELGPAGPVLFALGEDGIDGVLHGRLEAAGADLGRVHVFGGEGEAPFSLPESVPALTADVKTIGARLVILDPLDNFWTPGTNTGKASSTRAALTPLSSMAQELGVAVIVVHHLNKGSGTALHRFSGSLGGLAGVVRSALLFGLDPEDPDDEEGRRALAHVKSNWGKYARTEVLQHRGVELPDVDGNTFEVSRLEYLGDSETSGEELVANPDDETPAGKLERAVELLAEELADGDWRKKGDIIRLGKAQGISSRSLERAAKKEGIERKQEGTPAIAYWRFATFAGSVGEPTLANLPKPHGQAESDRPTGQVRQVLGDGEPPRKDPAPTAAGTDPDDPVKAAWAEAVKTVGVEFNRLPESIRDQAEPDPDRLAELEAAAQLAADAGNVPLALAKIREWKALHLDCIREVAVTDDQDRLGEAA